LKCDFFFPFEEIFIFIAGKPLNISVAYSGRIACAYKYGKSFTRPSKKDPASRYVNMCVAIYECESTGGKSIKNKYCQVKLKTKFYATYQFLFINVKAFFFIHFVLFESFFQKKKKKNTRLF
jgi:hypothetical protein